MPDILRKLPETGPYIACPECDLIHERGRMRPGHVGVCRRCGAVLFKSQHNSLDRTLALSLSGIVFFLLASYFPLLSFRMEGAFRSNQLLDGTFEFVNEGYFFLAVVVLVSSVLAPFLVLVLVSSILLPLKFGVLPFAVKSQVRILEQIRPWAMAEIFLLGILVAFVKLGDFAEVSVGVSFYSLAMMVVATVLAFTTLDEHELWSRIREVENG
ncbi:paraquat-inducible protein A [Sneathiella chinensis]|uniref:Paraquat-inducible protein A n=1 Tax=Sneathiella chinensis TaxID=349750 RepID=A0ABQ5U4I5_9PROT|nr:paraquat-inducible protein A [Sneathiella chinensis]GLQ06590.1 hypothetical protein GCM10007924_18110 [Sneathiella chinensis]